MAPDPAIVTAAAACRCVSRLYRTRSEQVTALSQVSKDFPVGAVSAIVGPSGSGKSSLLRILACVDRPDSGQVLIGGADVTRFGSAARRRLRRHVVSYVFQNPVDNLVEYLPAAGQIRLAAALAGLTIPPDRVDELLARMGLSGHADSMPGELSGGEQQRLAFACAVAGDPELVIADEPSAELDAQSTDRVLAGLHALAGDGVGVVVSSHDAQVVDTADHLLRLDQGRVIESW